MFVTLAAPLIAGFVTVAFLWRHALDKWPGTSLDPSQREAFGTYAIWSVTAVALVATQVHYIAYATRILARLRGVVAATTRPGVIARGSTAAVGLLFFVLLAAGSGEDGTSSVPPWIYTALNTTAAFGLMALVRTRWALFAGLGNGRSADVVRRDLRRLLNVELIWFVVGLAETTLLYRHFSVEGTLPGFYGGTGWAVIASVIGGSLTLLLMLTYYIPSAQLSLHDDAPANERSRAGLLRSVADFGKVLMPLVAGVLTTVIAELTKK